MISCVQHAVWCASPDKLSLLTSLCLCLLQPDLSALVYDPSSQKYDPHHREWFKTRALAYLRVQGQQGKPSKPISQRPGGNPLRAAPQQMKRSGRPAAVKSSRPGGRGGGNSNSSGNGGNGGNGGRASAPAAAGGRGGGAARRGGLARRGRGGRK
jgi:hypothetical protein